MTDIEQTHADNAKARLAKLTTTLNDGATKLASVISDSAKAATAALAEFNGLAATELEVFRVDLETASAATQLAMSVRAVEVHKALQEGLEKLLGSAGTAATAGAGETGEAKPGTKLLTQAERDAGREAAKREAEFQQDPPPEWLTERREAEDAQP